MNTIQVQLTEKQFDLLQDLIPYAIDRLDFLVSLEGDNEYRDDFNRKLEGADEVASVLNETKTYLWTESLGRIELDIPAKVVESVAQSGDNLPAVEAALTEHPYIGAQLNRYDSKVLEVAINETGIEQPAHTMNVRTLHQYLLWMACWDIHEEQNQED